MKPELKGPNYSITAPCPECKAITSFDANTTHPGAFAVIDGPHSYNETTFMRVLYVFSQCARCGRGGLAKIHDIGNPRTAVLETFFPTPIDRAPLPKDVPSDIESEFREAELCASRAFRAAAALFRSTLEKTLKANGYTTGSLYEKIALAIADGLLSQARGQRAHEIRIVGNDVLHEAWRPVGEDEVEASHRYTQRILEDFYDNRPAVEKELIAKNRIPAPPPPSKPPSNH